MRAADPFAALVDFMAFMVLISIVLFIISETNIPEDAGSKANVVSFRVTIKSAVDVPQILFTRHHNKKPTSEIEMTLWLQEKNGKPKYAEAVLKQVVVRTSDNQSTVFGVAPEKPPEKYLLSISHIENLDLIGTFVEIAIDIQIGKKSCSLDWGGNLGVDAGVNLHFDECRTS